MTQKKNNLTTEESVFIVGLKKAITILVGVLLAGAGSGFLGGFRLANDAITVTFANASELKQLENNIPSTYVRTDVYAANRVSDDQRYVTLSKGLDSANAKLDALISHFLIPSK